MRLIGTEQVFWGSVLGEKERKTCFISLVHEDILMKKIMGQILYQYIRVNWMLGEDKSWLQSMG